MGPTPPSAELPRWVFVTTLVLSVTLVIAVLVASAVVRSHPPEPVRLAAIPAPDADSPDCHRLLGALPEELDGAGQRRDLAGAVPGEHIHDGVAAWGSPAVVLYCGVPRPAEFTIASSLLDVSGVQFLELGRSGPPHGDHSREIPSSTWVAVDRPVYVAVALPPQVGSGPLQHIAERVDATLPTQELDPSPELPR